MIEVNEYVRTNNISRKEYLKKYDSNVGYALYVQDNIRKDDYVRLNTGNIVKVIGIKANTVNKRAIYYGFYKQDWFDSAAVENFSDNIIDLVEVGDVLEIRTGLHSSFKYFVENEDNLLLLKEKVKEFWNIQTILTKESYMANCYKVGGK
jgi:hypothetical protein